MMAFFLFSGLVEASMPGRLDIGAFLTDIDIVNTGKKVKNINMHGVSGDGTLLVYKGLCLKPSFAYAIGDADYYNLGMNLGFCIPVNDKLLIVPSAGLAYSDMEFTVDIPMLGLNNVDQKMAARSQNISLDVNYKLHSRFSVTGILQKAWSQTTTTIDTPASFPMDLSNKAESTGFNYVLALNYFLNDNWAINLAGVLQKSRSKEKHGMDAKAVRLAVGYMF